MHELVRTRLLTVSQRPQSYINSLPNELLVPIIEYAALSSMDMLEASVRLSRVDRRFRDITIRIPRLWSEVQLRSNLELTFLACCSLYPIVETSGYQE